MQAQPKLQKSDISLALDIKLSPDEIEIKENTHDIYIGNYIYNQKKFLRAVSYTHTFTRIFCILAITVELTEQELMNKYFKNYSRLGNGYDIASLIFLFISLGIPCFLPWIGRKLRFLLFSIICVCYFYLFFFLIRFTKKEYINKSEEFITIMFIMFFSSFGFLINVLTTQKKYNPFKGVYISFFFFVGIMIFEIYIIQLFDPYLWKIALYILGGVIYSFYLNYDCFLMIRRRPNYFLIGDWFLGYAHLESDWSLRFWRDIFLRKDSCDDDSLSEMTPAQDQEDSSFKSDDSNI